MTFVRTFDPNSLHADRFDYQILADFESCIALGARIPAGKRRGERHAHVCDQLFYVISGQLGLEMDGAEYVVPAGSVAFLPAGVPHVSWNSSGAEEVHLDLMAPSVTPGRPLSMAPELIDGQVPAVLAGRRGYVRSADGLPRREPIEGFSLISLADRSTGSTQMSVRLAEVRPGSAGTNWHIHEFDQFYLVLEGTLVVEVAQDKIEAGPMSFIRLPAGVPHRNWNGGAGPERHIAVLVPEPPAGQPADIQVRFTVSE
ncbi:MAG TPA: cupin domain-containing protein [Trebonia sp.]